MPPATRRHPPDIDAFLADLQRSRGYQEQILHRETIPARTARFADPSRPLPEPLRRALDAQGIHQLYLHQAQTVDRVRAGEHVVIVTSTASGKTLCYNLPVLESLLGGDGTPYAPSTALYLFPTKALAQDQLKTLQRFAAASPEIGAALRAGAYDGDTSQDARRKLRNEGNLILSNPDMLHAAILPYHNRWHRFLSRLSYVVVDEIHTYRGIFGSHVANVLRRLRRVARFHGADPVFLACSATIANPRELAESLLGHPVRVIDEDGSPRGRKTFVFWNPPYLDAGKMERRSSNVEGHDLMVLLVERGIQTIAFTKARVVAELVLRYVRESLERRGGRKLAEKVRAYRAGYLPEERRRIEAELFSGRLLGVASTNALELGIDVGTLDASLLIGFPGTIASTWQQAGRAGRQSDDALAVLIAYNDPIDQYLMRHPQYFFGTPPEHAVVDPANPHILVQHLGAAAFELPLTEADREFFGPLMDAAVESLTAEGRLAPVQGKWHWCTTDFAARGVSLRTISDSTFTILERGAGAANRTVGVVDAISAPELVYPGGVYLHEGETFLVRELDLANKVAYVERAEVDYYTQPVLDSSIRIGAERSRRTVPGAGACFGSATVTWRTTAFRKVQFYGMDAIGYGKLDLPPQHLETTALWLTPEPEILAGLRAAGHQPMEALSGARNVFIAVLPWLAMCDRQDVGGIVDASNTGSPTIFLYDRYHGGLGFAEKGYHLLERLVRSAHELILECPCEDGCPSCVGLPVLRPAQHQDPDFLGGWPIPSKRAALAFLGALAGGLGMAGEHGGVEHAVAPPAPAPPRPSAPPPAPMPREEVVPGSGVTLLDEAEPGATPADLSRMLRQAILRLAGAPEGAPPDLAALAAAGPEGLLFFDLETAGFAGTPLFLAGLMHLDGDDLRIQQMFARHYGEEGEVVQGILDEFRRRRCLVTFNGKSFDLPFLRERAVANRLPPPPEIPHVDLLHHARRAWRDTLPDCRLSTLEWYVCRRRRVEDVRGTEIPSLYHRFVRDGDPQPLQPVVQHNRLDLLTLAELLVALLAEPIRR